MINKTKPTRQGEVVKISGDKTIAVKVEIRKQHFTGKVIKASKNYLVHDAENLAKVGNIVLIEEGRKVARNKAWHLVKVISVAGVEK